MIFLSSVNKRCGDYLSQTYGDDYFRITGHVELAKDHPFVDPKFNPVEVLEADKQNFHMMTTDAPS